MIYRSFLRASNRSLLCNTIGTPKSRYSTEQTKRAVLSEADWARARQNLKISTLNDWYNVTDAVFCEALGITPRPRRSKVAVSVGEALLAANPQHHWHPWRFASQSRELWADRRFRLAFFENAATQLGIQPHALEQWYSVSDIRRRLYELGGRNLIETFYNGSILDALVDVYPEHTWERWRLQESLPPKYWSTPENQRTLFDSISKQLGVHSMEDWYKIKKADIIRAGGLSVMSHQFKGSMIMALSTVYPEHEWLPWKFSTTPRSFWTKKENVRLFLNWLGGQLGIKELSDWYKVSKDSLIAMWPRDKRTKKATLTSKTSSLAETLFRTYPDHPWKPWLFTTGVPSGYWKRVEHHRLFFEWFLENEMQSPAGKLEKWYSVPYKHVAERGGMGLLTHYYGGSLIRALRSIFPEHEWLEWKFPEGVSKAFWEDPLNQKRYFEWLATELGLSTLEDWYTVPIEQIKANSGAGLMKHHGFDIISALKTAFPDHNWDTWRFTQTDSVNRSANSESREKT